MKLFVQKLNLNLNPMQIKTKFGTWWTWFSAGLLACIPLLYILDQWLASPAFHYGSNFYLILITLIFLPRIRGLLLVITVILIAVSVFLLFFSHAEMRDWTGNWGLNLSLAALILCVPLLGIPVRIGGYIEMFQSFYVHYLRSVPAFYTITTILTHTMGVFLNLGSVAVFYEISKANPFVKSDRIVATALIRGFGSVVSWSPFGLAMALITTQLHVAWINIVWYMLGFALIGFAASFAVEWKLLMEESGKTGEEAERERKPLNREERALIRRKMLEIAGLFLLIGASVFLVDDLFHIGLVAAVCVVSLLFPVVWAVAKRNTGMLFKELHTYFHVSVPLMKKEVILFLTAGFFSGALANASSGQMFNAFLMDAFGGFTIGIIMFICISFIMLGMVGFPPVVIVTTYITMIDPAGLGFSAAYYALVLLGCWTILNALSPLTALSQLIANLSGWNLTDVTVRWNLVYTVLLTGLFIVYLELLIRYGGV